jgi:hypothetical protein
MKPNLSWLWTIAVIVVIIIVLVAIKFSVHTIFGGFGAL